MKPVVATSSILVDVPAQDAFRIFTDDVDSWWKRGPAYRFGGKRLGTLRFEPGIGGRLVETFDSGDEWEVGKILTWEVGVKLVFEYRIPNFQLGQLTEVEVLFEAVRGGTRVTIAHHGWEGIPPGHPARHGLEQAAFARVRSGWWLAQLRALRDFH